MNVFLTTQQKLHAAIRRISSRVNEFSYRPGIDFSRCRKISFSDVLSFVLSLQGQCLDKEMRRFFSYSASPTSSAMIQARQKVKPEAFEALFSLFTRSCRSQGNFSGYSLLAADGSKFTFPENKNAPSYWIKSSKKESGKNMLHLNALYQLQTGIFEEVFFQSVHEANEHLALIRMLERSRIQKKYILLADRGYESYNTFAWISSRGGCYLIRGKQGKTGISSGLCLPEAESFDVSVSITICQHHTAKTKEHPEHFKRIRSDAHFDLFEKGVDEYPLEFRAVRIRLSKTKTELLYTNLPKEEFPAEKLKELYQRRWGIETAFNQLKHALSAEALHSAVPEQILQELYGKLILFNFCKAVLHELPVPQKRKRIYQYQFNMVMALDTCRQFWRSCGKTAPEEIETLLQKYLVPIRENRSCPRQPVSRKIVYFTYRIS